MQPKSLQCHGVTSVESGRLCVVLPQPAALFSSRKGRPAFEAPPPLSSSLPFFSDKLKPSTCPPSPPTLYALLASPYACKEMREENEHEGKGVERQNLP